MRRVEGAPAVVGRLLSPHAVGVVVKRLIEDLNFNTKLVIAPTVREEDGLAMSSRNVYLCGDDRAAATVLFRALSAAEQRFRGGASDRDGLIAAARQVLDAEPRCEVDYVELRRERDLAPLPSGDVDGVRMLVAARFCGGARPVRLLDNLAWSSGGER